MAKKQKTRCAILGLLSWQPMSGYDIKKLIEMGLRHFWNESYGQLYPSLNQLVAEGLVIRKEDAGKGRRRRHIYSITSKGKREFSDWLNEPTGPLPVRNEFLLKFFLTGRQNESESIRLIEEHRAQEEKRLEEFSMSERILRKALRQKTYPPELAEFSGPDDDASNQLLVFLLSLRHGVRLTEARLAWCDEALKALRAGRRKESVRRSSS